MSTILFVRLPHNLQLPINGGCSCPYCKAHPHKTPKWDTLAVDNAGDSWPVHHPEPIVVTKISATFAE